MRKLATAFIVATSLFAHSVFADDREIYSVTVAPDLNNPEAERGYWCEASMSRFLNKIVDASSRVIDTKKTVGRLSTSNLLKDYELFDQYKQFKEYTAR